MLHTLPNILLVLCHVHCLPLLDNLSLSGSFRLNRSESFTSQKRDSVSSTLKRASISNAPMTATSVLSPVSDAPLTSVSIARHFELPVVMEEDEKGEEKSEESDVKKSEEMSLDNKSQVQDDQLNDEVFAPLDKKPSQVKLEGDSDEQHMDASTQTNISKVSDGDDEDLVNIVMRDMLYKYIPLPPSTATTPSASQCNLENY